MIRLIKIATSVAATWLIYFALMQLDYKGILGFRVELFPTFYAVALIVAALTALWDRGAPVFSSFAVGFLSVFQLGYVMSLWQAAKGYLFLGGGSAISFYMLIPLAFALVTGVIAATGGFLMHLIFHFLRGGTFIDIQGSRYRENLGLRVGYIASCWALMSSFWLYFQGGTDSSTLRDEAALLICAVSALFFFLGSLLAKAGKRTAGGVVLMAWGSFLAGVSFLALPFLPSSTVIGTLPGLLAIGAGVALYSGTQMVTKVKVGAEL